MIPATTEHPHSVALVMIVRDEAAGLRRALDSARPWVDRLVVVDTGSRDDTPAIARAAGAEVHAIAWPADFAAARNAALDLARADWHLVLDGDEWLGDGAEALAVLRDVPPLFVGALRVDSAQDRGGATTSSSWLARVLPGAVRYRGRIHEQPVHTLPVRRLPVVVHHDGYRDAALARKAGRNAALLQQALAQRPDDAYGWYQLGKDHDVYARAADALACFARAEALLPPLGPAPGWLHDLSVRRLHAFKTCARHADGMTQAAAELERWADSPDFFFALGDLLLDWAAREPQRADDLLPMIAAAWTRCLEIGERPDLEGAVAGRGSHLARHNLDLLDRLCPDRHQEPA